MAPRAPCAPWRREVQGRFGGPGLRETTRRPGHCPARPRARLKRSMGRGGHRKAGFAHELVGEDVGGGIGGPARDSIEGFGRKCRDLVPIRDRKTSMLHRGWQKRPLRPLRHFGPHMGAGDLFTHSRKPIAVELLAQTGERSTMVPLVRAWSSSSAADARLHCVSRTDTGYDLRLRCAGIWLCRGTSGCQAIA